MSLPVFKLNAQASHSICHVIDSLSAFLFWLCSLLFHCHWWAFSHFLTGFKICQPITDGVLQEGRWQPLYLPVGDILSPEGCVSFQQLMVRTLLPPFSLIAFLPSTAFFQFCTIPFSAFDMKVSQFTTCLWVLKFPGEWINAGTDFSGGFRVHFMEQGRGVCSEPSYTNYDNNLSKDCELCTYNILLSQCLLHPARVMDSHRNQFFEELTRVHWRYQSYRQVSMAATHHQRTDESSLFALFCLS